VPNTFYLSVDTAVLHEYIEVQNWDARQSRFTNTALSNFADVADACDGIGALYCDLNTMLRELHVTI